VLDLIRQYLFLVENQDQYDTLFTLLELFVPGMVDVPSGAGPPVHELSPLRRSIMTQFCRFDRRSHALGLITAEIAALRLRLYHRPRAVAFLLGRLGGAGVSVLSEDVFRMIVRFAEESEGRGF
jgi:hypothetical protein